MRHQLLFDTIGRIVEGICAYPEDLRSYVEERRGKSVLVLMPHMADYPKLIGKGGRQVKAFKHIVEQAGVILGEPIALDLEESFNGRSEPTEPWTFNPDFDLPRFDVFFRRIVEYSFKDVPSTQVTTDREIVHVHLGVDRTEANATIAGALDAMFYPYVYANGRKLKLTCRAPDNVATVKTGFHDGRSALPADGANPQP